MNLTRDFIWTLSSKTIGMAAGFLTAALINRSMGPAVRGIYAEMQTWIGLFAVLFGISMDSAIYHFANQSRYGIDSREKFATILLVSMGYACFGAIVFALFVSLGMVQVSLETSKYLWFLDFLLILTMVGGNLTIFLQALGNLRYTAVIGCVQGIGNAVIIGIGYATALVDIRLVLMALILTQFVSLLMILSKSAKNQYLNGIFSKDLAKKILVVGMKQHIATVSTFVYTKVNQLIIYRLCGEATAGIFAVSHSAAFYLMFIPMAFQTALYPRVIHAQDDYEITIRSLRLGLYLWGSVVFMIILFAKPLLLLYAGSSFLPSINSFRVLMVASWFLPLSSLIAPYYVKMGAFGLASLSAVLLGTFSIVLNLVLVPRYAAMGASLATSLTCLLGFGLVLVFFWYISRKNPFVIFRPDFKREISFLKEKIDRK